MANDPAFLFYPGDYLRDTQCLSERSQVAYDRIMCEHMRNICITQAQLDFFTKRLTDDERKELLMILAPVKGGFQIPWVVDSITKRREYSESRRKNREGKKVKPFKNISKSYVPHMENENAIENENINNTKKSKLEIFEMLFTDEIYIEGLAMAHKGKDIKQAFEECYIHHSNAPNPPREMWEWKQKFNTWLSIKSHNGNSKDKRKSNSDALKANVAADIYKASREQ